MTGALVEGSTGTPLPSRQNGEAQEVLPRRAHRAIHLSFPTPPLRLTDALDVTGQPDVSLPHSRAPRRRHDGALQRGVISPPEVLILRLQSDSIEGLIV